MASILDSVKASLGIGVEYTHFDTQLITDINSVFSILLQLGVGPEEGYLITSSSNDWDEFLPESHKLELVKTYVNKKVGLIFDPPLSSAVLEARNKIIDELEWRILLIADPEPEEDDEEDI